MTRISFGQSVCFYSIFLVNIGYSFVILVVFLCSFRVPDSLVLLSYRPSFCQNRWSIFLMMEWDSSDIPVLVQRLFLGADPDASRRAQPSPAELWTAGESRRKQVPPSSHRGGQNSSLSIGYTNRCLSEWNPYWLTRLIDSAAPATNCRLRLPPSVCNSDSGFRVTCWPPAYQI